MADPAVLVYAAFGLAALRIVPATVLSLSLALWSLHPERPDLVQKYTAFLEEQFEAHMALSQFFTPSGEVELTPEQLESLRTLGYIN